MNIYYAGSNVSNSDHTKIKDTNYEVCFMLEKGFSVNPDIFFFIEFRV